MIVISAFAFIYGIVAIANFGSSTKIYKYLIERIEELEPQKSNATSSSYNSEYYPYYYYLTKSDRNETRTEKKNRRISYTYDPLNPYRKENYELAKAILDTASVSSIDSLRANDLNQNSYGLIKSLKGIENGLGVILFIFPIIFLVIEIVCIIFTCGNKEFTVVTPTVFNVFNIIKIICITLSTIFIFLSVLYGILLIITLIQYLALVKFTDSCARGIIYGIVYGYYGFYYYIVLACAFCAERNKFVLVGTSEQPGPDAKFDLNGNQIVRPVVQLQNVQIQPDQIQIQQQPQNFAYPQNNFQNMNFYSQNNLGQTQNQYPLNANPQNYIQSQTNMNSNDECVVINGITYRKVGDNKTNQVSERVPIKQNENNLENKIVQ
jgi:hypothetical protein